MKNMILIAWLLLAFSVEASVSIITDLDDTIKITQASGKPSDILGSDVYTGMPEFFQAAAKTFSTDLYIITASPAFLRSRLTSSLKKKGINFKSLILRENVFESKFEYKVHEIKKILDKSSDDFILIGDDLGEDPEIYAEINRLYPGRILGTYIHHVDGRPDWKNTLYWTSFDLFLYEFQAGRMEAQSVEEAFELLNAESDLSMIFPKKANCPTEGWVWGWQTRTIFMQEADKLIEKFTRFCQARQSDILLH